LTDVTEKANHPVARLCRVLEVSASGFYAWLRRAPSERARRDGELAERIVAIHEDSRGTYGAPRIHAELKDEGRPVGRKRVARLMRALGLQGVHRRRRARTTRRDERAAPAPDLVGRDFSAPGPDALWVADITYVPTWAGFLYLAVVLDAFSRRVVGWAMAAHLRTELVLEALEMAIRTRAPGPGLVHHSDRGSQYTSLGFGRRCREAGIVASMGSAGDCYDNALCESFFATLETELIRRSVFRSHREARTAVFDYIEAFYNRRRRHSALGYLSPAEFERRHAELAGAA
jgi:putative transposase